MTSTATAILLLFHLAKSEVESRITAIGLNRIVVTQTSRRSAEGVQAMQVGTFWRTLENNYALYELRRTYFYAETSLGQRVKIFAYQPAKWQATFGDVAADGKNILINEQLEPGTVITCWVNHYEVEAVVARPLSWMSLVDNETELLLLADDGVLPVHPMVNMVTVYEHDDEQVGLRTVHYGLTHWLRDQGLNNCQVVHALKAADELGALRGQLTGWRAVLIIVFGTGISVVFSLLVVLEMYENRQVNLVLRSMGAPGMILVVRQFIEGVLVSNAALALTWLGMVWGMPIAFESFGYQAGSVSYDVVFGVLLEELPVIGGFVNAGILMSLIPVMRGVGGEIGRDLS
ncbi:hypothetical protein [Poriferisphaera sp. WC338]|uniref:hypothetical protein n=1 Tax=Poriferisphaera sp. WC338 TaxID=3425129 RepID=UPI003D817E3D